MNRQELVDFLKQARLTATDETALIGSELYPDWKVRMEAKTGDRYQCDGRLYKCITPHITQDNWRPGEDTASLWAVIDVTHAGTLEDPVPFALNMEVFKDKYYSWQDKIYLCTRDSGQPLQNPPDQLIGHYFTEA